MDLNILRQKVQEEKAKLEIAKANGSEIDIKITQNTLKFLASMIFELIQNDGVVEQLKQAVETKNKYEEALESINLSIESFANSSENASAYYEISDFLV